METVFDFDPPEIEWIAGRGVPKVSPTRKHGKLQLRIGELLERLGGEFGEVASEWRVFLPDSPDGRTTLVPDVAFVSRARLAALRADQVEEPPLGPDIAVEVLSPSDRRRDVDDKIALYLRNGTTLVLEADPNLRRLVAHSAEGARVYEEDAVFEHPAVEWLRFEVAPLFERLDFTP